MIMNRRNLLKRMGDFSLLSSFLPFIDVTSSNAKNAGKVVIVGAGWGGLSAAKTIKRISPQVEVIIIDPNKEFVSCPMSNWVIGQLKSIDDITFNFEALKNNYGIKFIHETAINIDPDKKIIITDKQNIVYDKLILSPGVQLDYSTIENWHENYIQDFPAAWKAGEETILLSNKIKNLPNGCLLYTSPSPRDGLLSRMPSSA